MDRSQPSGIGLGIAAPFIAELAINRHFVIAREIVDDLIEREPDSSLLLLKARIAAQTGKYEDARNAAKIVLENETDHVEAAAILAAIDRLERKGLQSIRKFLPYFIGIIPIVIIALLIIQPLNDPTPSKIVVNANEQILRLTAKLANQQLEIDGLITKNTGATMPNESTIPTDLITSEILELYHTFLLTIQQYDRYSTVSVSSDITGSLVTVTLIGNVASNYLKDNIINSFYKHPNLALDHRQLNVSNSIKVIRKDSLSIIAKYVYGKASDWPRVMDANKMTDPNIIFVGDIIHIPD